LDFGARVAAHRHALHLTQEDLAERAGLHRTYVGSVERGEANVTLAIVERIALALDVPTHELLYGVEH
jgi:transcriptional regulator with XRE-family HTH domain